MGSVKLTLIMGGQDESGAGGGGGSGSGGPKSPLGGVQAVAEMLAYMTPEEQDRLLANVAKRLHAEGKIRLGPARSDAEELV